MAYLDCCMDSDLEGHPSMTYTIDVNNEMVKQAIAMLDRHYDNVEIVMTTQGQSPVLLSAFLLSNSESLPPTIQNSVENIKSELVEHGIMS